MGKKAIVLADNSYTIRRIVELSFSEIDEVEVFSFENGRSLKDKLLDIKPAVAIIDIKLPEINGYEICRFINKTEPITTTLVYLMKGSFDPIDQEQIKNLKYEEIITKPFDSNLLVTAVMKKISDHPVGEAAATRGKEIPSTLPEDFAEIEAGEEGQENISFSDIKKEIFSRPVAEPTPKRIQGLEREEVQPSEEITQGAQFPKEDLLAPEGEEAIENPFENEPAFESDKAPAKTAPEPQIRTEKATPPAAAEMPVPTSDVAVGDTSKTRLMTDIDSDRLEEREGQHFPGDLLDFGEEKEESRDVPPTATPKVSAKDLFERDFSITDFIKAPFEKTADKKAEVSAPPAKTVRREDLLTEEKIKAVVSQADVVAKTKNPDLQKLSVTEKDQIVDRMEDKLTVTIKELLWDIVPPLAEKIIKEEIDKIKEDLNKSDL